MTGSVRSLVALMALAGCGAPGMPVSTTVSPQILAMCSVPGLQAKLEISGLTEPCPLVIEADHTVTGLCPSVPAGAEREFRLVYFLAIEGDPVPLDLAEIRQKVNLIEPSDREIDVSFPADALDIDIFDDDGDQVSNIEEVCLSRHPRVKG